MVLKENHRGLVNDVIRHFLERNLADYQFIFVTNKTCLSSERHLTEKQELEFLFEKLQLHEIDPRISCGKILVPVS